MYFVKMIAAVIVAGVIAYGSGFVADKAVHAEKLEKNAVPIDVAAAKAAIEEAKAAAAQEIVVAAADGAPTADGASDGAAPAEDMSLIAMIAAADVERGKKVSKACNACHTFDKGGKNRVGPNQWDLVGRAKGTVEGFKYSDALKNLGGTWTYEELDAYLANPKKFAPGNKMTYAGVKKAEDRAALIAWLRLQSDNPHPLEDPAEATTAAAPAEEAPAE